MTAPRVDEASRFIGSEVVDDFGRSLGVLVAIESGVDGRITNIIVKVADKSLEVIEGERVRVFEGKLTVTPEWKYEILEVIDNLERAYKRKKAIESISSRNELPSVVVDPIKKKLEEEIRSLRIKADEVRKLVSSRISEIETEELKVARAVASVGISYFSGEVSERGYTQSMNHLKKLQEALGEEKRAAKELLEKLEKVLQLASEGESQKQVTPVQVQQAPATSQPQAVVVKVEG
ncbi:MAG: CdvA-like protein [Acidilobus sp.]|nr:CdvA-like protein [Acidilobus sp.]MCG2889674.1 CdvA-like protein [Acidilobus sp.]MCG2890584.1 CdvA-like protein [Acidilobus sp.]